MIGGWDKSITPKEKKSLLAVLTTFALDSLSATIVFPLFAPLFLSEDQSIFQADTPLHLRAILLGFFLGAFPLAQFLFSPLIGEFADRKGRRGAYIVTLILGVFGYFISAYAISSIHLSLLFLGRFLTGLAAGNMSVCLATLVDLSKNDKTKMRYFSYGSAVAGIMYVLGPFMGGKLADRELSPWFTLAFPMWVGGVLTVINLIILLLLFQETKKHHTTPREKEEAREKGWFPMILEAFNPVKALHNMQFAFKTKEVRRLYLIYFFFLFAWNMVYQFLPAVLVAEFQTKASLIGNVSALMGVFWIIGTLAIGHCLHTHMQMKHFLIAFLVVFALAALYIPFPKDLLSLMVTTSVAIFFAGGMWPFFTMAISKAVDDHIQGKVLGLSQSIQSFAMLLASVLGGFFLQAHAAIPFAISALSAMVAALLLTKVKNHLFRT